MLVGMEGIELCIEVCMAPIAAQNADEDQTHMIKAPTDTQVCEDQVCLTYTEASAMGALHSGVYALQWMHSILHLQVRVMKVVTVG